MAIFTTSNYFLSLAVVATILLWGVSVWNGTVLELILTSWNGKLEDGKSFSTNYTGIFLLDFPISLLVGFFFYGTNGSHPGYQLFLLDAYSNLQPAFIWLYLEASRQDAKPSSVANPIIWGLMWQMFGAAIALPLYFYNHLKWLKTTSQGLQTASLSSAMSLPFSFIIGVVVPTVIGELPTWVSRSDYLHQQVLAFWQPAPIWISLVQTFFVFSMGALAKDNVKSSEWVKASYLLAASLSALGHIYVVSAILRSSDPTISFTKMYTPYLVSGPEDAALRLANGPWLFLQYDYIIIALSSLSWAGILVGALLSEGLAMKILLPVILGVGSLVIGSGATVSLALLWREGVLTDKRTANAQKERGKTAVVTRKKS